MTPARGGDDTRSGGGLERYRAKRDFGATPEPAAAAEAERRRLGARRAWLDARAVVAHDDRQAGLAGVHLDLERARLALVGVDDDVRAGLRDGHLHVGEHRGVEVQRVGHAGQRLADHRYALRARRHPQTDFGRSLRHSPAPLRAAWIASSRPLTTGRTGTRPVMSRMR